MLPTKQSRKPIIAVIGHASHAEKRHLDAAYETGKLIAESGAILITGGNDEGVPDAAAMGATESGGIAIGISYSEDEKGTSKNLTVPIKTGMGFARNQIIGLTADVLIAIGGGVGTFCEMAYAYAYGKPTIIIEELGGLPENYKGKYLDEKKTVKILKADSPKDAVNQALEEIKRHIKDTSSIKE